MNRLLLALIGLGMALRIDANECSSLNAVEWVIGEWQATPGQVVIREQWQRVSETTFEGESVTTSLVDGEVANHESLRLLEMSDGVFYLAKVTHEDLPVPFRLTECSNDIFVFENADHDAPQRLIYTLMQASGSGKSELEVRLEGDGMKDFSLIFTRP